MDHLQTPMRQDISGTNRVCPPAPTRPQRPVPAAPAPAAPVPNNEYVGDLQPTVLFGQHVRRCLNFN